MALQKLVLNGSETGATAGTKINAIIDSVNSLSSTLDGLSGVIGDVDTVSTSLSTLTGQINTLPSLTNQVDTNTLAITDLEQSVTALSTGEDTGKVVYGNDTAYSQGLQGIFEAISFGDTAVVNRGNGHITYNTGSKVFSFYTTAVYQITLFATVAVALDQPVRFGLYKNGVNIFPSGGEPTIEGRGADLPQSVTYNGYMALEAGDQLQVRVKQDLESGGLPATLQIYHSSIAIKKEVGT